MKKLPLLVCAVSLALPLVAFAQSTIISDEEARQKCFAMCPNFGTDEYVECFKAKCTSLFDVVEDEKAPTAEEWRQIRIARSDTACEIEGGGNEQFYIMVARTPSEDYGTREVEAGILNPGDKFEIPEGDWSVWLKGTQGTMVNVIGGTVMQIPCAEPGAIERVWGALEGGAFFETADPVFVDTRLAVVGVKGTRFIVDAQASATDVYVLQGVVEVKAKNGGEITLNGNQWASATASGVSEVRNFESLPAKLALLGASRSPEATTEAPAADANGEEASSKLWIIAALALIAAFGAYWFFKRRKA